MFCSNCGKEIPNNTNFCNYCGAPQNGGPAQNTQSDSRAYGRQQSTAYSQPVYTAPPASNAKKKGTKKKVGIVLVCLQIVVLIGGLFNGTILGMLMSGPAGFFELIGYCAVGIVGVILICKANKEE